MPPEKLTVKVDLEGNFFKRDPGKTLGMNVRDMLKQLAAWMETEVRSDIASHAGSMPFYTGWSHDRVVGHVTSNKTGKQWRVTAAVQSQTLGMSAKDAIRTKAAGSSIEGRFHPYRRIKGAIYRSRPILTADLTKGLN